MKTFALTTSFGRRPATLGQIAAQLQANRALETPALPGSNAPAAVNKWALSRTLTEIRERLGVSDRALSVLNALLSFHPEVALTLPGTGTRCIETENAAVTAQDGVLSDAAAADIDTDESPLPCDLIVFPSNKALSQRAHGMADRTLLRHLTDLVAAGLIIRRDSPNGKRYARKDASGRERFSHAYGFDLTPLVARALEFETMAEEARAQHRRRTLAKERISLLRRDVSKLVSLGLDEALPGDWEALRLRAMALMIPLRRLRDDRDLATLETDLAALQAEIAKLLESHVDAQNQAGNDRQTGAHQSNSNSKCHAELEPSSKEEGGDLAPSGTATGDDAAPDPAAPEAKTYPLGMVMEACPDLRDYGPAGRIRSWSEFMSAAAAVRPMIGISPDAWADAQSALGKVEAHVAVAVILQRSIHSSEAETLPHAGSGADRTTVNGSPAIRSAGGYLRALTEEARAGTFALGPILMATIGQRLKAKRGRAGVSPVTSGSGPASGSGAGPGARDER